MVQDSTIREIIQRMYGDLPYSLKVECAVQLSLDRRLLEAHKQYLYWVHRGDRPLYSPKASTVKKILSLSKKWPA